MWDTFYTRRTKSWHKTLGTRLIMTTVRRNSYPKKIQSTEKLTPLGLKSKNPSIRSLITPTCNLPWLCLWWKTTQTKWIFVSVLADCTITWYSTVCKSQKPWTKLSKRYVWWESFEESFWETQTVSWQMGHLCNSTWTNMWYPISSTFSPKTAMDPSPTPNRVQC